MKKLMVALGVSIGLSLFGADELVVSINPAVEKGQIKMMNCVNNGPTKPRKDQSRGNFDEYAALKIPYARIHDANHCSTYGAPHTVDVSAIFPNWDADETKAESYDFTLTDAYLKNIIDAGTEPFFRLGESIEHAIKKYRVNPPKDFAKWARVCEHIVRHYNEGWADGFTWNIKYWEIWNEPSLETGPKSPCWTGTKEQFMEFYKVVSLHLRKCFGETIKIGGPAMHTWAMWRNEFIPFCAKEKLPLDFYSWHCYAKDVRQFAHGARSVRKLLDDNGFTKAENHLNEWNYVKGWSDDWIYSLECESGRMNYKGAAFIAAAMIDCQDSPMDMMMFYDARVNTSMNNMFHHISLRPMKGYYPFMAWNRLRELGVQVESTIEVNTKENELYACAAKGKDGKFAIFLARYNDDDNISETRRVTIKLPENVKVDWKASRCHMTDIDCLYTETPLLQNSDGTVAVKMLPNSFVLIEL